MTKRDKMNDILIKDLIKKRFSLDKKSQALFNHRIHTKDLAPEFAKVLENSKDYRARITLDDKYKMNLDEGWKVFKNTFSSFVSKFNVTYSDYLAGTVLLNKQKIKIKKAICAYEEKYILNDSKYPSKETIDVLMGALRVNYNIGKEYYLNIAGINPEKSSEYSLIKSSQEKNVFFFIENKNIDKIRDLPKDESDAFDFKTLSSFTFDNDFIKKFYKDHFKKIISDKITEKLEKVGAVAFPKNKKLELVMSCNFADTLMASTGESWGSCINLESHYDECFWAGLPGLIADKSRCIFYITDGKKKRFYTNKEETTFIETDRFLSRSWAVIMRSLVKNNTKNKQFPKGITYLNIVKDYPNNFGIKSIIKESGIIKDITVFDSGDGGYDFIQSKKLRSKYLSEALYFREKNDRFNIANIYNDNLSLRFAKKGKAEKAEVGTYYYYRHGRGRDCLALKKDVSFDSNGVPKVKKVPFFSRYSVRIDHTYDDNVFIDGEKKRYCAVSSMIQKDTELFRHYSNGNSEHSYSSYIDDVRNGSSSYFDEEDMFEEDANVG